MSKYVILSWNSVNDISLAYDMDGKVKIFDDEKIADEYSRLMFPWNYKIVQIEKWE